MAPETTSSSAEGDLPPSFFRARELITTALADGERASVPSDSLTAAMMVELMPRLVGLFGHRRAAQMLRALATEVLADGTLPRSHR